MSGSLLGRGRGGRLALYAGSAAVIILMIFVYRAAVLEMARLRDLHEQCALNQESLQQQLQVIFEYKVRLEKSLADETSANAAVKQELQQRATMEKSQLDKVTMEAEQRFKALQQDYKALETGHNDFKEDCDRRKKQALENSTRLELMVQELKQARDDKILSLENLKSKNLQIDIEKSKFEQKYNDLVKSNDNTNINAQRLEKQVFQLRRELEDAKRSCGADRAPSSPSGGAAPDAGGNVQAEESRVADAQNAINLARPPSQSLQQGSSTTISRSQTIRVAEVLPKASTKPSTQSAEKINAERAKVKLPAGVLPIPRMYEAEKKSAVPGEEGGNDNHRPSDTGQLPQADKDKPLFDTHDQNLLDPPRLPPHGRHAADQPLGRQDGRGWQNQVLPGVQEVGEEPNNLEKIHGLEDAGNHPVRDGEEYGQYEGGDYDKELPMRNNDLHIEEGEDEGEDEDDMEYEGTNLKADKHPE